MAILAERRDQFVPADLGVDRNDLAAWNGHVIGVVFAEMQQVAQHLALDRREVAIAVAVLVVVLVVVFVLVLVDRLFELRAQRAIAVADLEDFPDRGRQVRPEPAATLRVSRG